MELLQSLDSELSYARKIAAAGWEGIASARHDLDRNSLTSAWMPTAIGAGIGVLSRMGKRRSTSTLAMGGLIGSFVGLSAGLAWGSRQFTATAARNSSRLINAVLDERWLERNPIDFA